MEDVGVEGAVSGGKGFRTKYQGFGGLWFGGFGCLWYLFWLWKRMFSSYDTAAGRRIKCQAILRRKNMPLENAEIPKPECKPLN